MRQLNIDWTNTVYMLLLCICLLQLKPCNAQSGSIHTHSLDTLLKFLKDFKQVEKIDSVLSAGKSHLTKKDFEKVVEYAEWGLTQSESTNYAEGRAKSYLLLSSVAARLNKYVLMVDWALKAEKLLSTENDFDIEIRKHIYISLSSGYTYLKRFAEAKSAYQEAIRIARINNNYKEEAGRFMGLGNVYYDQDIYDSALMCFEKAKTLYNQIREGYARDYVEASIGNVYDARKEFQKAKISYEIALGIYRKNKYSYGITWMQNNLASTLTSLNEISLAQLYLDSATLLATENKYHTWKPYLIENQVKIYEKKGDFKNAFKEQKKLQVLKDSLEKSKAIKELSEIDAFDIESKFEAIRLKSKSAEALAQKQKMISFLAILSTISTVLILIIISFYFKKEKRYNYKLKSKNNKVNQTNKELNNTQRKLKDAYEELSQLNLYLEEKVRERTEAIERKTSIITEYANFNAHKLRGVLTKFLGLFQLFEIAESIEEKEHYISLMVDVGHEMDEVIHEISNILGKDFFENLEKIN